MLGHLQIAALIPHHGAMCLLDRIDAWSDASIRCSAISHLDPANPLRRQDRLSTLCGLEYAFQAAAAHGALRSLSPQPPGRIVVLRDVDIHRPYIDDAGVGRLQIKADMEHGDASAMMYRFILRAEDGCRLAEGRVTIALSSGLA